MSPKEQPVQLKGLWAKHLLKKIDELLNAVTSEKLQTIAENPSKTFFGLGKISCCVGMTTNISSNKQST